MRNLFDSTGLVGMVAEFISQPNHQHDNVSFHGLPFAKDSKKINHVRKLYAKRITEFYLMNHIGLNSNCSSFAEYLRCGHITDIRNTESFMNYQGDMYPYHGQHLNFGDVIMLIYFRQEVFEMRLKFTPDYAYDLLEYKKQDVNAKSFLTRRLRNGIKPESKVFKSGEIDDLVNDLYISNFHFLVCVGYEIHPKTGNLEPIFVNQDGRNFPSKEEAHKILLPPFGKLGVDFVDSHISEKNVPAMTLCSKPLLFD